MINCRNCTNWIDESLERIEAGRLDRPPVFQGCKIFGYVQNSEALDSCEHYVQSHELFTLCATCRVPVPRVCLSLGECVNCTDTDLYCVDQCRGGESRRFCTHFVRLHTQGIQLIDNNQVFDLYPSIGMPGQEKAQPGRKK